MDGLSGHLFEVLSTEGGAAGDVPEWAPPYIVTISESDITNNFIDLPSVPIANSLFVFMNGVAYSIGCDFFLSGGNRITFAAGINPRIGWIFQARYQTP
jgi:hypothetical protein